MRLATLSNVSTVRTMTRQIFNNASAVNRLSCEDRYDVQAIRRCQLKTTMEIPNINLAINPYFTRVVDFPVLNTGVFDHVVHN